MPDPTEESIRRIGDRVMSLEELLTHLERTVSELDGVVGSVQDRLDAVERRVDSLSRRLNESAQLAEDGVPEDGGARRGGAEP